MRFAPGSFLDRLPLPVRTQLLALGTERRFEGGRRLLREGDRGAHVELLTRGFVKITAIVEGVETLLAIRVPGDILGETAALTGRPRTATVTTCGRITSVVVSQAAFHDFMRRNPDAPIYVAATMGDRLHWANERRADFAAYPAEVRLARLLAEIAETIGHRSDAGIVIGVGISQSELATMIGVAEATAQKAIRDLRREGAITTGYRSITVVDIDRLRAMGVPAADTGSGRHSDPPTPYL
jgi:CRP/FNR family transcriptional regulator, cyclic AMP receptor protein